MTFSFSTPRRRRASFRRAFNNGGDVRLVLVSPNYHGRDGWRFGLIPDFKCGGDVCHLFPEKIANSKEGRIRAIERFGVKAVIQNRPAKKKASAA